MFSFVPVSDRIITRLTGNTWFLHGGVVETGHHTLPANNRAGDLLKITHNLCSHLCNHEIQELLFWKPDYTSINFIVNLNFSKRPDKSGWKLLLVWTGKRNIFRFEPPSAHLFVVYVDGQVVGGTVIILYHPVHSLLLGVVIIVQPGLNLKQIISRLDSLTPRSEINWRERVREREKFSSDYVLY